MKQSWIRPGAFRLWLLLVAAVFFILLAATQFLPGGTRSLVDWWQPLLFLLASSLAAGTLILGLWALGRCLLQWRVLKPMLLLAAGVVVLAALVYAEEDWRGWHAWHHFKQQWEAKGEHFSVTAIVPAPVPDEQNFALTPLVFTSYGKYLTRTGRLIPAAQRDENFEVRMRMPLTLDNLLAATNCAGDRVKGTFTRLDCWRQYYRTLAARTNAFPVPERPQSAAADVLLSLSRYDAVLAELRSACRLPESRYPVNYDSEAPYEIYLPHLAVLKNCAQFLQLRSVAELQNGQPDQALSDLQLALQLADKVHTEPILISHLVRIAMVQLMLQPVWEGLAQRRWTEAQLVALEADLAKLDFAADWKLGMKGELAGQADEIEFLCRHPDRLRGMQESVDLEGHKPAVHPPGGFWAYCIPRGWFYQNQYRCARLMEECYLPMADASRGTFSPELAQRASAELAAERTGPFNMYKQIMLPSLVGAARRFAYGQASVNLARTAIALERCRLLQGSLPESLAGLAPRCIAQVPRDVIGRQPLKYRREAEGRFMLYSVGWNQSDEGGTPAFDQGGALDLQNGDWVWCYPPPTP